MNVLITGAGGFVGTRLLELYDTVLDDTYRPVVLSSKRIEGFKSIIHKNYTYTIEDIRAEGIDRVDAVIHIGHFLAEHHKEVPVMWGNVSAINNTKRLLDNLPNIPKRFIYISSMDVYGIHRLDDVDEASSYGGVMHTLTLRHSLK